MNHNQPNLWSVGAASEQGRREENQDRMTRFTSAFGELVVVADGMGGARGGATAATAVVRRLPELLAAMSPETPPVSALRSAVQSINAEVFREGHSGDASVAKMGTTIVLALIGKDDEATIAHIGDSRAYLFRGGKLQPLTKDHSAVQRLVDLGAITPEQARVHPDSSVITRAIGQQPEVELEVSQPMRLLPGDGLLLCSDGLSGYTSADAIAGVLRQSLEPPAAVAALGQLALDGGSDDNITIQYLLRRMPVPMVLPRANRAPMLAAAAMALVAAVGVGVWLRPVPVVTVELRLANSTVEPMPSVADVPKRAEPKGVVLVQVSGEKPEWLARLAKLGCVDYREKPREEVDGKLAELDPTQTHILFLRGAKPTKDCVLKQIKELAGAKMHEVKTLPKNVSVLILLPTPDLTL